MLWHIERMSIENGTSIIFWNKRKLNLQIIFGIIDSWLIWWQYLPMPLHYKRKLSSQNYLFEQFSVSCCQTMILVSSIYISSLYMPFPTANNKKMYYTGQGTKRWRHITLRQTNPTSSKEIVKVVKMSNFLTKYYEYEDINMICWSEFFFDIIFPIFIIIY